MKELEEYLAEENKIKLKTYQERLETITDSLSTLKEHPLITRYRTLTNEKNGLTKKTADLIKKAENNKRADCSHPLGVCIAKETYSDPHCGLTTEYKYCCISCTTTIWDQKNIESYWYGPTIDLYNQQERCFYNFSDIQEQYDILVNELGEEDAVDLMIQSYGINHKKEEKERNQLLVKKIITLAGGKK